ncbi:MAG TPA: glycoside hydrolase family 15 protein [Stellaceae bacterium]|jgi:glucoamylase|nr:glycoside hydrolase family 15 protein [Stellaceae bacterium]
MPNVSSAPGGPGIRPTWTSSAKDMVTTALGVSRVWVTVGYGIINEVYAPETGMPQLRDLGFIVAGPSGWYEVKRVNNYHISLPEPYIPLPHIVHQSDQYRLVLEVVPDPRRDVVLVSFRLIGEGVKLYTLLAPHLRNSGEHNNALAGDEHLAAWRHEGGAVVLLSSTGFSRTSAGYVGTSDGWQDFAQNGRMTWTYGEALDGNVALLGELQENHGTLALALSVDITGARTKARSSLSEGYASIRQRFVAGWEEWGKRLEIPEAPADVLREAYLSAAVLKVHQDRSYPGSIVASLSVPWGNSNDTSGGYHLVWARDCVEAGLALLAVGQVDDARSMLCYLVAIQNADGSWPQNCFPDGHPFWTGIQLDEVAFPIILAAKLAEEDCLDGLSGVDDMIRRAARYILHKGPVTPQDRWEENAGVSPFTLAVEIVALIAASQWFEGDEREYMLSLADCWNDRIEDWTYTTDGPLAAQFGVDGYYVRIGPDPAQCGLRGRVVVANRSGDTEPAVAVVGMEYLHLVRLGLRSAQDRRIQNTSKITEALLKVETPLGIAYHRYNGDGYGEQADGRPYDGNGIGRAWPLLTGERAHFELQAGHDPLRYLRMMARMTGPTGLIPEQVWDGPPLPDRLLEPGKPTGSAMPLVWAHAEFLKLLCARKENRPLELLSSVENHLRGKAAGHGVWRWRSETPFETLPADRDLVVEGEGPFLLHFGFDGWQDIQDRGSAPLPFGRHGVRLAKSDLARGGVLDFTRYFSDETRWEGSDHHVRVAPQERSPDELREPAEAEA